MRRGRREQDACGGRSVLGEADVKHKVLIALSAAAFMLLVAYASIYVFARHQQTKDGVFLVSNHWQYRLYYPAHVIDRRVFGGPDLLVADMVNIPDTVGK